MRCTNGILFQVNADQPVGNYWIRADPNNVRPGGQGFANGINSAILRYKGAPEVEPTTNQTTPRLPLNETDLHPLDDPAAVSFLVMEQPPLALTLL